MNRSVYATMIPVLYGHGDYYTPHVVPTRGRRFHPYPSRPALASGGHCMSDDGHSSSFVSVKMEPRQGAGNDVNGGGSGGGMFSDYSYLPATESPHSSPGGGGGHHNSQQSAYFSSSSSSSPCSLASSLASSAAAVPMAYENHRHEAACVMHPTTAPALGCGATVGAAVSTSTAAPAAAAAVQRDRYDATDGEDNFILTHQIPMQSGIVTMAPNNTQLPSADDFSLILDQYINNLSPKEHGNVLISSKRLTDIEAVLRDPESTTTESSQFRSWAKKKFRLGLNERNGCECVMYGDKPVAVREKLYQVLTTSHIKAQHGGHDKTSAQVRAGYSW